MLPTNEEIYDPRIQILLDKNTEHWGNPIQNRERLIPYGIAPIDKALYGIDPYGEVIVIQGEEKNRKTTLLFNIIANYMTWAKLKEKPVTNIDELESGMRPEKVKDIFISIIASRYLMENGHRAHEKCPVCEEEECRELILSPKFLRYNTRSKHQLLAIDHAVEELYTWPLLIHGASLKKGDTRNLARAIKGTKTQKARWVELVDEFGMRINATDHVQQYAWSDEPTDYEKQIRAVGAIGDFTSQYEVTNIIISQVSLWSAKEVRAGGDAKLVAAGGAKSAQEANTVFSMSYKYGVTKIKIEESRDAGSFAVWQRIEDVSGTFYGAAELEPIIL
jgi:hypothetical protein